MMLECARERCDQCGRTAQARLVHLVQRRTRGNKPRQLSQRVCRHFQSAPFKLIVKLQPNSYLGALRVKVIVGLDFHRHRHALEHRKGSTDTYDAQIPQERQIDEFVFRSVAKRHVRRGKHAYTSSKSTRPSTPLVTRYTRSLFINCGDVTLMVVAFGDGVVRMVEKKRASVASTHPLYCRSRTRYPPVTKTFPGADTVLCMHG